MADGPEIRFVVFHRPGPAWLKGVDLREQPGVFDHVAHYRKLQADGKVELGGPFMVPDTGGMMITTPVEGAEEIEAYAKADPAVASGLITVEIRPWYAAMKGS